MSNIDNRHKAFCAACLALSLASPVAANITSDEREILEAFYQAANGDGWFRNDGWLQAGSDPCDWYGVACENRFDIERDIVRGIDLSGNNLTGTLDPRIFEIAHVRLNLSDNALGGTLDQLPASPGRVDLSNNMLGGGLPSDSGVRADVLSGTSRPSSNWYLDLSGNDFEGQVPSEWEGPVWLSLANNRLEGMPLSLLEGSRHPLDGRFLDLSDNQFSGGLPASMIEADFMPHDGPSRWGGGLNLCWNDWSIPDSAEFQDWLRDHHVGGEFESCLSGERQPVGLGISGSWYDPDRDGEGIAMQQLDNGQVLIYFFTFDEAGRQQWLFDVQGADENNVRWREMLRTRGRFGEGLLETDDAAVEVRGSFRIDRLGNDRVLAERVYIDNTSNLCLAIYPPTLSCFGDSLSDRREYQRLSQLAGTSCDHQSDFQQYSGAWYNPERSGEGFIVEVLSGDRAVVYWFTYSPDDSGQQAWIVGTGTVDSGVGVIGTPPPDHPIAAFDFNAMVQPVGTEYGPGFDSNEIDPIDWGSLRLEFYEDGSGRVLWDSNLDEYGSGDYPIERLARPMLGRCDSGQLGQRPFRQ